MTESKIRELSIDEIEEISAGLGPLAIGIIAAGVGAGIGFGLNSLFGGSSGVTVNNVVYYC